MLTVVSHSLPPISHWKKSSALIAFTHLGSRVYRTLSTDLPFSASESRLVKEFSQYGQIAEVKLVKDEAKQKSKGFAFIQYTSQEAALIALESMDRQLFDDRRVFVELANLRRSDFGGYPKTSGPPQEQQKVTKDDVDE
ncbi:hypothetical protein C2S51_037449 [Perilla frutescens var. frutescens]|nr:hypothetical protein C2S51_037449 [Perilla frutescens var. frutescens]